MYCKGNYLECVIYESIFSTTIHLICLMKLNSKWGILLYLKLYLMMDGVRFGADLSNLLTLGDAKNETTGQVGKACTRFCEKI